MASRLITEAIPDYTAARRYLDTFITRPGVTQTGITFTPEMALARTRALMARLGNPQDARPVVHLAGTSGKGSTATILSAILQAHGLHVGLGVSPHVRHLRERIQIDGLAVSPEAFTEMLASMQPAIEAMRHNEAGPPSFFEIQIALSHLLYNQANVDVVVMETGMGGRHDGTNTITREDKVAVLTPIGLDHVALLGRTLTAIAQAKAGIIQPHNTVINAPQAPEAAQVIAKTCREQSADLHHFVPEEMLAIKAVDTQGVRFDLALPGGPHWPDLALNLLGEHQAHNAGLAILAARHLLQQQDLALDEAAVRAALRRVVIPGRMDRRTWLDDTPLLIDGAHNVQKMYALVTALQTIYPGRRFIFVVALKDDKETAEILRELIPVASHIVLTAFENRDQGMFLRAAPPEQLAAQLREMGFVSITLADDAAAALHTARARYTAHQPQNASPDETETPVVVTGSLYLLAGIYAAVEGQS